ncbi:MAG: ABC transporter ATP-binding protein [Candidatus Latescibacterota bacterium]|nr:MAG: ABC transporter ATP-binding protein [Candidatus Latescibacterota bacterium]
MGGANLLAIEDLRVAFDREGGGPPAYAVDSVSLSIAEGEVACLVGESGCGKSLTALSVLGLVPSPPGRIEAGRILFRGTDLLRLAPHAMRALRGASISMVFQEPMTSLNPVLTCGSQIAEVLRAHRSLGRREAGRAAVEMLRLVGIADPAARAGDYPHRLSGGMRQRVLLAIALACRPALLIADEPTTALDVTIQAQILRLILDLKESIRMSVLFITHDLAVVAEAADRVAVMYAGEIVEEGSVGDLFRRPKHPYTQALLRAAPVLSGDTAPLRPIEGSVATPEERPEGCRFHPRCPIAESVCREAHPDIEAGVRCHLAQKGRT